VSREEWSQNKGRCSANRGRRTDKKFILRQVTLLLLSIFFLAKETVFLFCQRYLIKLAIFMSTSSLQTKKRKRNNSPVGLKEEAKRVGVTEIMSFIDLRERLSVLKETIRDSIKSTLSFWYQTAR
jgi:hypothetical protein